jgi:hypothetical protein
MMDKVPELVEALRNAGKHAVQAGRVDAPLFDTAADYIEVIRADLAKAQHGLAVGQAAHKAALDTHSAILDTAEAMKPEPTAAAPAKQKKPAQ